MKVILLWFWFLIQVTGVRALTHLSAQMCRACLKGRLTVSFRLFIWTSRVRSRPEAPTWTSATGRVSCSRCGSTWHGPGAYPSRTVLGTLEVFSIQQCLIIRACVCLWRLRERHQDVLRQKLYKLKQEQGVESEPLFPIIKEEPENERPMWVISFLPERSDLQVLNFF